MIDGQSLNEFRIIQKLGEGSFADVYKVKSLKDQQFYAEKRLKKRYRSFEDVKQLTEVAALRTLSKHPNIINLRSLMYDSQSGHVALILELMEMNLYEYISKAKAPIPEFDALLITYQLTKAISYVHSRGIFHRDVKPENCLINSQTLELKLTDFGSVSSIANKVRFTDYVATRWYRAPECILTSGIYGPAVDVWAIGCVLYEVLTGKPLFPGKHQLDQLNKIHAILGTPSKSLLAKIQSNNVSMAFPQKQKQSFRDLLPNVSQPIIDLIEKLLVYDPNDRITADEALKSPAFQFLHQQDLIWEKTDRSKPFALFATEAKNSQKYKQSKPYMKENLSYTSIGVQKVNNYVIPFSLNNQKTDKQPDNNSDTRKMAAQRVIEFNKRHMMSQAKIKSKQQINAPIHFQNPQLNIIHPRLPPIEFRSLAKLNFVL
ncbi:CMGC family protein kinase [Histomonas meleagridis]|uniref:CMGC family protein kinase n=1 Tax=Histomonas meleagridis TaxID=135588 RepID=UPI003559614D|nr:CMGC family protein kinase [Histomonas meleagridis]KAH0804195.1 CMGC family protein kinase [Histomonas meleagridis]